MEIKNTVKDWDRLAAQAINSVLAPKGFVKVENGHWKGMEKAKSDHPFLSKHKVIESRAVAAQLVRNFRNGIKSKLLHRQNQLKEDRNWINTTKAKWWEFGLGRKQRDTTSRLNNQIVILDILIEDIDQIEVK
jgi:hypothetical protein